MAGIIAPNKFPKCGVPVLCTPVNILDIFFDFTAKLILCLQKLQSFHYIWQYESIEICFLDAVSHLVLYTNGDSDIDYVSVSFYFDTF